MNRAIPLVIFALIAVQAFGQRNPRKGSFFNKSNKQADQFLQKQWWLGFKAGPNLSKALVEKTYHIVSPVNYNVEQISKTYENFRSIGSQFSFELTFYFRGISVSFQPSYRTNRFRYSNQYEWTDAEQAENRLVLDYEQEQKIAYLDWPLLGRYEFNGGKLRPYVQAGVYSSWLIDATKSVTVSGIDHASGGANNFKNEPVIVGATDLFAKYHWGIVGGGGIYYSLGNVRVNVDVTYKRGMSNIASTENRYASDRLSGVGDSMDDMTLDNLVLSVGCLFPLRFLGSGFKSMVDN